MWWGWVGRGVAWPVPKLPLTSSVHFAVPCRAAPRRASLFDFWHCQCVWRRITSAEEGCWTLGVVFDYSGIKSCHSFPGAAVQYIGTANNEQPMHLIRGPGGCFDGTINSLMKLYVQEKLFFVLGSSKGHTRTSNSILIQKTVRKLVEDDILQDTVT